MTRDYWTTVDHLGHDLYVDAVAAFIQHADTCPPLTIGIRGPWGWGKTSLMRMIRDVLDPTPDKEITLVDSGLSKAAVTIRSLLKLSNRRPVELQHEISAADARAEADADHRPTVWFNAWMYQSSEQIWAGLASAIAMDMSNLVSVAGSRPFGSGPDYAELLNVASPSGNENRGPPGQVLGIIRRSA